MDGIIQVVFEKRRDPFPVGHRLEFRRAHDPVKVSPLQPGDVFHEVQLGTIVIEQGSR